MLNQNHKDMKIKHWICYCFLLLVILTLCWWTCGDKWYRHGIQKKGREYIKLIELYLENTGKTPYSLDDLHAFRDALLCFGAEDPQEFPAAGDRGAVRHRRYWQCQ